MIPYFPGKSVGFLTASSCDRRPCQYAMLVRAAVEINWPKRDPDYFADSMNSLRVPEHNILNFPSCSKVIRPLSSPPLSIGTAFMPESCIFCSTSVNGVSSTAVMKFFTI